MSPYLESFPTNNVWTLLKAFKTFVRPILEYGSVVWSPYLIKDIVAVESVQRFFTKSICRRANIPFTTYHDRLFKLNLQSLERRRITADLMMTFKIVHGLVGLQFNQFFSFHSSPYNTRSHRYRLFAKPLKSNFECGFFSNRVVKIWNNLPEMVVESTSLTTFRSRLQNIDLSCYLKI